MSAWWTLSLVVVSTWTVTILVLSAVWHFTSNE